MKKIRMVILGVLVMVALPGCSDKISGATEGLKVTEAAKEGVSLKIITSDMLGQGIYEALEKEWAAWDAKDEMQKLISSHMPGFCYKSFGTWEECEAFLGFDVFNPLEESDWPEKATYVGMPEGYNDAPRFHVSFYGTRDDKVEWISVESGYRSGEIRITVNAQVVVDSPVENSVDNEPIITEDSGERYVASTAVLPHGPITYNIRVIGEPGMQNGVRKTLEQVLPCFEDSEE